jgi:competence protein ComEC
MFCFCFLFGVGLTSVLDFKINFVYLYISLFIIVGILINAWKNKSVRFGVLCIGFFVIGIARYLIAFPIDSEKHIIHYAGQKISLKGYVSEEPDVRTDGVRYIVNVKNISESERAGRDLPVHDGRIVGKIYVKSGLYPRYNYGDELEMKCDVMKPEATEDGFAYDKYLGRYGVFVTCESPFISKIGEGKGNIVLQGIYDLKNILADHINQLWHEPYASFMAGLLYGYRGGLGELNDLFSRTGITHIVAISGYNITVIATILITLCVHACIPRKKAFLIIAIGICLFVIFTGASASVVRAGIMGIIVLLARQVGRLSRIGNVLVLTASVMTLLNPYILIWDAGFQLSFISTLGLVYLTPIIRTPFDNMPEVLGIKESLISTLCAITATLPLILYQFGRLSIVAPIVNILVLWIIPWLMMIGFVAVVLSFVFYPIAYVVAWIGWVGLSYIMVIVKWFANLPFAAVNFQVPVFVMILLYCGIIWGIKVKSSSSS